jgi:hypothetical protein
VFNTFFVLITGNGIVLHDGRKEKNGAQGKHNEEGKRKGTDRGERTGQISTS